MVLNRIRSSFSNSKKYLLPKLLRKKSHASIEGFCCIGVAPQELTLVYTREISGKTIIELCESHPYDKSNFSHTLTALVKNNNLKKVACSLMLQPDDYQLLVTDALPVAKAEFQDAIRWKIKDLIRFPAGDVLIDSFLMPKMKTGTDKIMVVAAQTSALKTLSEQIHESGLELKFIDIPELGLRNISVLYEKDNQTTTLLYIQENSIQLLITFQQQIYVSRLLKFSLNNDNVSATMAGIERLASEIQRSFDYYQSLWNQPLPSGFIFSSTKKIDTGAINFLAQRLNIPVEIINIANKVMCKPEINIEQQGKYLAVIGGALRESTPNATN